MSRQVISSFMCSGLPDLRCVRKTRRPMWICMGGICCGSFMLVRIMKSRPPPPEGKHVCKALIYSVVWECSTSATLNWCFVFVTTCLPTVALSSTINALHLQCTHITHPSPIHVLQSKRTIVGVGWVEVVYLCGFLGVRCYKVFRQMWNFNEAHLSAKNILF